MQTPLRPSAWLHWINVSPPQRLSRFKDRLGQFSAMVFRETFILEIPFRSGHFLFRPCGLHVHQEGLTYLSDHFAFVGVFPLSYVSSFVNRYLNRFNIYPSVCVFLWTRLVDLVGMRLVAIRMRLVSESFWNLVGLLQLMEKSFGLWQSGEINCNPMRDFLCTLLTSVYVNSRPFRMAFIWKQSHGNKATSEYF